MASVLTIGQLAKGAGVNVQTIRYYERRNLLQPAGRKLSGYRVYDHEALQLLRFIKNAQALEFTLHEIEELLNLRVSSKSRCGAVQRRAEVKLEQVEVKVRDLKALATTLRRLIRTCRAGQTTDRCSILKSLEK
ncbi:MAG TPA: heavy metal-responsive transcriptional regulator [Nitrospira sp.]|nr:heavy metal-responsive transcriptional regulator [Nitrospira sp.]